MIASIAEKYQRALWLTETAVQAPSEAEVQALWFESLIRPNLLTDLGTIMTVVQPGIWNRVAGPDFFQSCLQESDGRLVTGAVEIHLRATEWETHGHHQDARYENTVLHGVWFRPLQTFFPSTKHFRRIPQTILCEQLIAPWAELSQIIDPLSQEERPLAQPGICQRELSRTSPEKVIEILRSAGAWRLRKKAERLRWRERTRGRIQGLWESLAEALGYAQNKMPMRLLAQRAPASWPEMKDSQHRTALLFGIAGFLPSEVVSEYSEKKRSVLLPLWDLWWRDRDRLQYALLPREVWNLSGLRPYNRPERRIAALSTLYPFLSKLEKTIHQANDKNFARILLSLKDPLWSYSTTWHSRLSPQPSHLIGMARINDILINIFWPLVSLEKRNFAYEAIQRLTCPPTQLTRIARERVLGPLSIGKALREALVQQGLLQLYQDFCLTDDSACHRCPFPEVVRKF